MIDLFTLGPKGTVDLVETISPAHIISIDPVKGPDHDGQWHYTITRDFRNNPLSQFYFRTENEARDDRARVIAAVDREMLFGQQPPADSSGLTDQQELALAQSLAELEASIVDVFEREEDFQDALHQTIVTYAGTQLREILK